MRKLSNFNIIFTQMKQQTNNLQSTTAQALTSFPENPQLYIFAYTITDIMHIEYNYWLCTLSRQVPMQDVSVNLKVPVKTFHCLKSTGSHFTRTFFKISENFL
jgi:hypothetical protein